jgi:hypothetical protein
MRRLVLAPMSPQQYDVLGMSGSTWSVVLKSLAWSAAIVAVFAPLAVAVYRRAS